MNTNILFFTQHSALYGANKSLLTIVDGITKKGWTCVVISSTSGKLNRELDKKGIENHVIPFVPWVYKSDEWSILKTLKNKLFHSIRVSYLNYKAARLCSDIIQVNSINLIYSNSSKSNIGHFVSKMYKLPHVWHLREFGDKDFDFKWCYGKRHTERIIDKADCLIAVSHAVRKHHCRREDRVHVIYDGVVPESHFHDSERLATLEKRDTSHFVFAVIGSISPAKGQVEAIRAFADVNKIKPVTMLLLIGKGDTAELKKMAMELNVIQKVEFTGHVENVFEHYQRFDCLLVCSRSEGFGMITVEAMAGRKPVIVKDSGGPGEIVEDGLNGLKYNQNHVELVQKMIEMMEKNAMREKLIENAYDNARNFTHESFTKEVIYKIETMIK